MIHKTVTCLHGCAEGACIGECRKNSERSNISQFVQKVAESTLSLELESLPYETDLDKDIEYFFDLYKRNPASSRVYKNLITALQIHHIRNILKKEEK